jgi:crotonobetainyl-CoA:carnitine CoA-transferase CaiB-like acyl-CoA transferase
MLGDMGADVIKVERPIKGDDSRMYGPAFLKGPTPEDAPQSAFYLSTNRNKRSITIDISKEEGQDLVRDLAKDADIVLENYRVGTLSRYRLDYAALSEINPRIVYCSVTAYGQTGPYKGRPGYDGIFQAAGGLMSVTGLPDDQPGGGPMKVGPSIADVITGYNATIAVLSALRHRDQVSGRGQPCSTPSWRRRRITRWNTWFPGSRRCARARRATAACRPAYSGPRTVRSCSPSAPTSTISASARSSAGLTWRAIPTTSL